MSHIFNPKNFKKLDHPNRKKALPIDDVLSILELEKHIHLADVGCGVGYFAFPFAEKVELVYAIDTADVMIEELKKRNTYSNIKTYVGEFTETLENKSVDVFFTSTLIHELPDFKTFTQAAYHCIKDGGQLVYLDFDIIPNTPGPALEKRVPSDHVVALFQSLNLKDICVHKIGDTFYMVVGRV